MYKSVTKGVWKPRLEAMGKHKGPSHVWLVTFSIPGVKLSLQGMFL